MSIKKISTMADVIVALDAVPDLKEDYRADLKRSVRRVALLLDPAKDPSRVPVSRATANRIAQLTPAELGCTTPKTVANVISLVKRAVELVGAVAPDRGRIGGTVVADAWASLLERRPKDPYAKEKKVASRVARWAVAHGFTPKELPEDTFDRILAWNQHNSWSTRHRKKAIVAMRGWNRLVDGGAEGRKIELKLAPKFTRPLTDFQLSFQQDVNNYEDFLRHPENWRQRKGCIIAGETRQIDAPRSERTIKIRIMRIRYLASLLVATGFPIEDIVRINVLAAGDNVDRIMHEFERRSAENLRRMQAEGIDTERGDEKTISALSIAKEFRAIICGWCAPKSGVLDKFKRAIIKALSAKVTFDNGVTVTMDVKPKQGHTAKNKKRLRDATADQAILSRLVTTPERVMRSIEAERRKAGSRQADGTIVPATPTRPQAKRFETALAAAIDLTKPQRRLDLANLNFRHYLPPKHGRVARFEFRASKNSRLIVIKLGGELLRLFELFVTQYRPVLLGEAPDLGFLFVGLNGNPISENTLADRLRKFMRAETGLRWNSHLFRHFDGWVVKEAGGDVGMVADLLSISVQTAKTTYDSDRQEDAQDHLDASMDAIRAGGRRSK